MIVALASTSSVRVPAVWNKIKYVMKSLSYGKKQRFVIRLVINTTNIGPYNDQKELFGMENGIYIPSAPCLEQKLCKLHCLSPLR